MNRLLLMGADRARLALIAVLMAASAAVGATASLSAAAEWMADRDHPEAERTYRVSARATGLIEGEFTSLTPRALGDRLDAVRSLPATTVVPFEAGARSADGASQTTLRILYVDERFPEVFDYGVTAAMLADMDRSGGVMLTSKAAALLAARPGQEMVIGQDRRLIAGVLEPPMVRSHLEFDAVAPSTQLRETQAPVTPVGSAATVIVAAADATTYTVADPRSLTALVGGIATILRDLEGYEQEVALEPLTGLRDAAPRAGDPPSRFVQAGHLQALAAAAAIALVALLGAASSLPLLFAGVLERQRRVLGLLGALGHSRAQLRRRFAGEMLLVLLVGLVLGLVIFAAAVAVSGADGLRSGAGAGAFAAALGFALLITLITGAIALVLAARQIGSPIGDLLDRRTAEGARGGHSVFVTLAIQAGLSFAVIGTAALVFGYLNAASRAGEGYARVWAVEIVNPEAAGSMLAALRGAPGVVDVQASAWRPYGVLGSTFDVSIRDRLGKTVPSSILVARGDLGGVLGQGVKAGTSLKDLTASPCRILVNETLIRRLALTMADAVGSRLDVNGLFGRSECTVQGVVEDQQFSTGPSELTPAVHMLAGPAYPNYRDNYLLVRTRPEVEPDDLRALLGSPDDSLEPVQLGSIAREAYRVENNLLRGLTLAALVMLAVSIATLASSVALSVETRTVEIGVRRALGHRWREIMVAITRPSLIAVGLGAGGGALALAGVGVKWAEAYGGGMAPVIAGFAAAAVCLVVSTFAALAVNWFRLRRVSPADVLRS